MKILQKTEINYDVNDTIKLIEDILKKEYPGKEIKISFNTSIEFDDSYYDRTGHSVFNGFNAEII